MRRCALALTLISLIACPAAAAQRGVTIDPDSPTAKEYALPLDSARRAANGAKAQPSTASPEEESQAPAPLFGEGVGEDPKSPSGKSKRKTGTVTGPGATPDAAPGIDAVVRSAARTPGAPDGGGIGTGLLVIGIAAAVVGTGAGVGLALRRRRS